MTDVTLIRLNLHEYAFGASTARGKHAVATALTFVNPNPYDLYRKKEMFSKTALTFQVGLLRDVLEYCKENDVTVDILNDGEYPTFQSSVIDNRLQGKYQHQQLAVQAFFRKRIGIIQVPTRGGKTFIASEIIRLWQNSTKTGNFVFVVDTEDLFRQAKADFEKFFEPYGGIDVGEIRAGKFAPQRITVAMIQTVQRMVTTKKAATRKQINNFFKTIDFLAVDEIHDNASFERLRIFQKCRNLRFQLCLSATPYRDGAWYANLKLRAWSGDIIYRVEQETLIDRGVLTRYEVMQLVVDHNRSNCEIENDDYRGIEKALIHANEFRNLVLLQIAGLVREQGLKTLFLFQSIAHGRWFEEQTGIPFIHGETPVDERTRQKDFFLREPRACLAASGIFKKGITLPEARIMVAVDGGKETANVIQKSGRVLGAIEGKDRSAVIDFIDIHDRYFSEHSEGRLQTYLDAVGEEHVHIVDTGTASWLQEVENWLTDWFNGNS